MGQGNLVLRYLTAAVLIAGLSGVGFAQAKPATVPESQIEANVLKSLAGAPQVADESMSSTTVYGTVSLSGTVRDEASRNMAEQLVSNAAGVQKVVDELTIGTGPTEANDAPQAQNPNEEGTNPNLQSDGTMAPAQPAQKQSSENVAAAPQEQVQDQQTGQGAPNGSYRRPYARPYGPPPPPAYSQQPRVEQQGGEAVAVPVGTRPRVRINEGTARKRTPPGPVFEGVALNDVVTGGSVPIHNIIQDNSIKPRSRSRLLAVHPLIDPHPQHRPNRHDHSVPTRLFHSRLLTVSRSRGLHVWTRIQPA